jgi:DNA-binding transcriptional MerR regulator
MEAFTYAARKTAAFYEAQKRLATEHAVFNDTGRGEPVRAAGDGQGILLASLTLLRLGNAQQAASDPAKHALLEKKEELEQKIDTLKYQKAAMDPADYKKQLTEALVELAKVQEELDK